jgi:hypothetical protein
MRATHLYCLTNPNTQWYAIFPARTCAHMHMLHACSRKAFRHVAVTELRERVRDLQFVRTTSSYSSWAPAIVGFASWAAWKQLVVVSTTENLFSLAATDLIRAMGAHDIKTFPQQLPAGVIASSEVEKIRPLRVRVVMVMASQEDVMAIALAAKGMTQGWAWLGLDSVGEAFDKARRLHATHLPALAQALNGWVYFTVYDEAPASFYSSVLEATHADFPHFEDGSVDHPLYASNLYDAILLYAHAYRSYSEVQDDSSSLKDRMIKSVSFDGMTGRVDLDEHGDMMQSISIVNIKLGTNGVIVQEAVGLFDGATQQMSPTFKIIAPTWPGGARETPIDSALTEEAFNTVWILVGCLVGATLLVIMLVLVINKHSERFKHFFQMLVFEVGRQIATFCSEVADFTTDAVSFHRAVVANSLEGAYTLSHGFKIAYSSIFAAATVASAVSMIYRGMQGYKLLKAAISHGDEFAETAHVNQASTGTAAMFAKLRWEAQKSKRDIVGNLVTLFTAAFEDVRLSASPSGWHRSPNFVEISGPLCCAQRNLDLSERSC